MKAPITGGATRRRFNATLALGLASAAVPGLSGCASEPKQAPTRVLLPPDGPRPGEAADLAGSVAARVVVDQRQGRLGVLDTRHWQRGLRPYQESVQPSASAPGPSSSALGPSSSAIWEISNPDDAGAVCVLTAAPGDRRHAIHRLQPGRPPRTVWQAAGDPLWDRPVSAMALSADGTRLAMVVQPDLQVRYRPLNVGRLVVLELAAPPLADGSAPEWHPPEGAMPITTALGQRPAWLEGARTLAFAAVGPQGLTRQGPAPMPAQQPDPHIHRLDLQTGRDERWMAGHSPAASGDGAALLLARGPSFDWGWVDLRSGRRHRVPRIHGLGLPLAVLPGPVLVFMGAAHPDAPQEQTVNNSPLVGPKAMRAIKLMDLRDGRVQTILEGVDPRTRLSAGLIPR